MAITKECYIEKECAQGSNSQSEGLMKELIELNEGVCLSRFVCLCTVSKYKAKMTAPLKVQASPQSDPMGGK